jgi:hypothetical protein
LPPGDNAAGNENRTNRALVVNERRERSYVRLRFRRKRSPCCQMLLIPLRTRVVSGEKSGRSETVVHFTEVSCTCHDVIVRIKGINAQSVTDAQFNPSSDQIDVRYLVAIGGKAVVAVFVDVEVRRGGPLLEVAWRQRERSLASRPGSARLL